MRAYTFLLVVAGSLLWMGCDDIFGSKSDPTTDEIFEEGRIEPGLFNEVEYVPLNPFYLQGGDGSPLQAPTDVYVGYDELIYVTDARGLHVLDLAGRPASFIPIAGGGLSVIQSRDLDIYVTARRDTTLNGRTWNLPVIIRYEDLTIGSPRIGNIIWHPFDDDSRRFSRPDPIDTDEDVTFTGVAMLANNNIYVSRRGPVNDPSSVILPHNTVMEFNTEGINTNSIVALNPNRESLRSAINPTDVMTVIHPPQRESFTSEKHFTVAQSPYPSGEPSAPGASDSLQFAVLSIRAVETTDGIVYQPDTQLLVISENPDRGDGFLYDPFKFISPSDMTFAADGSNYVFVTDAERHKLFVFTGAGVEGVAPPPGSSSSKPVIVSFGSLGDGALQFNNPQGVAYFERIVYVADTGNNRISRFRLNTDFE